MRLRGSVAGQGRNQFVGHRQFILVRAGRWSFGGTAAGLNAITCGVEPLGHDGFIERVGDIGDPPIVPHARLGIVARRALPAFTVDRKRAMRLESGHAGHILAPQHEVRHRPCNRFLNPRQRAVHHRTQVTQGQLRKRRGLRDIGFDPRVDPDLGHARLHRA